MAFSNTPIGPAVGTGFDRTFDITATADGADLSYTFNHNIGITPAEVILTPILLKGITSGWFVSAVTSTQVTVNKGGGVGTGDANAQVRLTLRVPHSIIQ